MDMVKLLQDKLVILVEDYKVTKEKMDEISEWNSLTEIRANTIEIKEFIQRLVILMEAISTDISGEIGTVVASKDKRNAVVNAIDDMIKLPWFLEMFDGPAIGIVVDGVCTALNTVFGNDWNVEEVKKQIAKNKDILKLKAQ